MILVTGGAGFIGSHLVDQLVAEGATVRVFERPGVPIDHLPKGKVEVMRGDIRDRQAVRAAVAGCARVYHLAANPNLWTAHPADFAAVNYYGAVNVFEEALAAGVQRILHTSTESILSRPGNGVISPDVELHAADMIGPYCQSKYLAEADAFRRARAGAPLIVVNPTLPVGPGDRGRSPPTRMTVAFCRGSIPAYLDCGFNMIDARDVAAGMRAAMAKGRPGTRYILGARNLRLAEWLAMIANALGRKPPRWRIPYWMALGVAHVSECLARFGSRQPPIATVTGVKLTRRSMYFDAAPSLNELGITPRPLEESLRDAIAWYRAMGWLD